MRKDSTPRLSIEMLNRQDAPPDPCWITYGRVDTLSFSDPPTVILRGATGALVRLKFADTDIRLDLVTYAGANRPVSVKLRKTSGLREVIQVGPSED